MTNTMCSIYLIDKESSQYRKNTGWTNEVVLNIDLYVVAVETFNHFNFFCAARSL